MIVGVGLDLVDVDRFRVALGRTPHLVERLFTAAGATSTATATPPLGGPVARPGGVARSASGSALFRSTTS